MANQMKYYVNVELRDYNDNVVAWSSCNLDTDLSGQSIADAVRVAGELMLNHHTGIAVERRKQAEEILKAERS